MKISIAMVGIAVVALLGCKTDSQSSLGNPSAQSKLQSQSIPVLAPTPRFGWRTFHEETFEASPIQEKWFPIPPAATKLRASVRADSAVFGGVFRRAFLSTNRRILRARDFQSKLCSLMFVDQGDVTCAIDGREQVAFVVRDKRAEGTLLMGAAGIKLGSRSMAERASTPNRIHITLATWQCIEHCRTS